METFDQNMNLLKLEKQIAWVVTVGLMVAGIPLLKAAIAYLVKLCELLVQYGR